MIQAVRLVKSRFAATAFDGEGAREFGARWNSPGTAVVYVAENLAVAMLEALVHLENAEIMRSFSVIEVEIPEDAVERFEESALPDDWRRYPPPASTQGIGDAWVREGRSAALRVPSVVVPAGFNFLLNPAHPDFARLRIGDARAFEFDVRLRRA